MANTYVQSLVHIVFSTKDRHPIITQQSELWAYMAGICNTEKIFVHEICGMPDHAHLLIQQPPTMALSDIVYKIKTGSSQWMGPKFAWQRGFGAFSVSASNIDPAVRYIRTQEKHHKKMTFEVELLALLKKHKVRFDPKYVFG
ncbi:MAG TPA: IS200/IS605 family transposase [Verrucomicrobiae bacterium]|nr:IS200/IS605 family transposase [Verrucomicrobiae bacterium]